jgi:hypothetical protein
MAPPFIGRMRLVAVEAPEGAEVLGLCTPEIPAPRTSDLPSMALGAELLARRKFGAR